jgi:hypothetical protein
MRIEILISVMAILTFVVDGVSQGVFDNSKVVAERELNLKIHWKNRNKGRQGGSVYGGKRRADVNSLRKEQNQMGRKYRTNLRTTCDWKTSNTVFKTITRQYSRHFW